MKLEIKRGLDSSSTEVITEFIEFCARKIFGSVLRGPGLRGVSSIMGLHGETSSFLRARSRAMNTGRVQFTADVNDFAEDVANT